jgi:hypothetical protein
MKPTLPTPKPIDDFQGWLATFGQPTVLLELALLGVCVALAWAITAGLRRALGFQVQTTIMFGRKNIDGVLFPFALLCLAYLGLHLLGNYVPVVLFKLAVPVLM